MSWVGAGTNKAVRSSPFTGFDWLAWYGAGVNYCTRYLYCLSGLGVSGLSAGKRRRGQGRQKPPVDRSKVHLCFYSHPTAVSSPSCPCSFLLNWIYAHTCSSHISTTISLKLRRRIPLTLYKVLHHQSLRHRRHYLSSGPPFSFLQTPSRTPPQYPRASFRFN